MFSGASVSDPYSLYQDPDPDFLTNEARLFNIFFYAELPFVLARFIFLDQDTGATVIECGSGSEALSAAYVAFVNLIHLKISYTKLVGLKEQSHEKVFENGELAKC
jgi:hypothetical protein